MPTLPLFTVTSTEREFVTGTFEVSPFIGEGWIGALLIEDRFVWGHFRQVDMNGRRAVFWPKDLDNLSAFVESGSVVYLDGYWAERAELVLKRSHVWREADFEPQDAVRYESDQDTEGRVIEGGWDHEHCRIC